MSDRDPVRMMSSPLKLTYVVHAGRVTRQFLSAIVEGRLEARRCSCCEKVYFPPRGACPTCAIPMGESVEVGPRGTITTFSVVRLPFAGQVLTPPYACAHILLDGADVPLLHIVGACDVDEVVPGLRVEPVWVSPRLPTLASIRCFRPVQGSEERS